MLYKKHFFICKAFHHEEKHIYTKKKSYQNPNLSPIIVVFYINFNVQISNKRCWRRKGNVNEISLQEENSDLDSMKT